MSSRLVGSSRPLWHVVWIKICDDIPISPDVIDVNTLNFKPNFKFSAQNFFGDPQSQLGCALGSLGQSLACIKIFRAQHPLRAEIQSPEKCPLGWVNMHVNNFFVCGPKSTIFFRQRGRGYRWSSTFPIFDSSIRFGDIREQSRKLSEIAPNFGRFSPSHFLGGLPKIVPALFGCLATSHMERFGEDILSLAPKLYRRAQAKF